MKTLFTYELKKLIGRKTPWVALALGLALFVAAEYSAVNDYAINGYARGYRDVYLQYEGQTITDAFQVRVTQEYNQYISTHAGSFERGTISEGEPEENVVYFPIGSTKGYDAGVWQAYNDLKGATTLEEEQEFLQYAKDRVAAGRDEQGTPLTPYNLRDYQNMVRDGVQTPIAHYTKGWNESLGSGESILGLAGIFTLICSGFALLGLFNGETSARMDMIVLSARCRRQAAWAKLWAGALVALGVAALFFGLQFAVSLGIWGTDGAALPIAVLYPWGGRGTMTIGAAHVLSAAALLAMAVACGAVVAWASARFRHPLATLLVAGAILAGMALMQDTWAQYAYIWINNAWFNAANGAMLLLPSIALIQTGLLPYRMQSMPWPLLEFAVPLAFTSLFFFLAYRAFLRRRRA